MVTGFENLIGDTIGRVGTFEMVVRALIVFVYGLVLGRVAFWRAFGKWSPPDIIVAIIVGSNLSRTLTGPAPLIPVLTATTVLVIAYWAVSRLASASPRLDWLVKGTPIPLVRRGVVDGAAMRRCALSARDLEEAMREKGFFRLEDVDLSYLERNGQISVLRKGA